MISSGAFDAVTKLFDPYSRVARLYPSLIAFAPVIWSAVALFPSIIETASRSVAFVTAAACMLYFLTSIARSLGKRAEDRLLKRWGGWPTTIFLRHRDETIDSITKTRYHQALAKMCHVKMPTLEEEQRDQAAADNLYRSVTRRLIEQRRGPAYGLIHTENASYGFRRNLYGLKVVVLVEIAIMMLLTLLGWWLIMPEPYTRDVFVKSIVEYPHFPVLFGLNVAYLLLWLGCVTPLFVYQAGREYAESLLRTLDA